MQKTNSILGRCFLPDRFAHQGKRTLTFDKRAPSDRNLRIAEQLGRQDEKEQIGAAVPHQFVELRAVVETILQRV